MGQTFEQHLHNIELVLERLKLHGFTVSRRKCEFAVPQIKYLGFIVSKDGICTDPDRISAITDYPRPKTPKQVRKFPGLCGWYRQYVDKFAYIAAPLQKLTHHNVRFKWLPVHQETFEKLKTALVNGIVLAFPDFNLPFIVQTDASDVGVSAVLSQVQNGQERVISFSFE